MSYYEVPEHCANCGIELNYGGYRDTWLCYCCWKEANRQHIADMDERA